MANNDGSYSYRYFTADLLTNEVFGEIPFKGVSYERALKGAGAFSGTIGITPDTAKLGVYDFTLPGKTALYVVRNGVCVWGGIIWGRTYNVITKVLNVNASEFTSYLYHRRAWRTWNNSFTGNLSVSGGVITATIDDGMTYTLNEDSSVHIIMSNVNDFKYNGYYQLTADSVLNDATQIATFTASATSIETPTASPITMPDGTYEAVTIDVHANTYDYVRSLIDAVSKDFHGSNFPTDEIEPSKNTTLAITNRGVTDGVATITMNATPTLIPGQEFRVFNVGANFDGYQIVTSTSGANVIFESGGGSVTYGATTPVYFRATSRTLQGGTVLVTTDTPHSMYVGQYVTLEGLDNPLRSANRFDGTVQVTGITSAYSFTYETGSKRSEGVTALTPATVTKSALKNLAVTAIAANGTTAVYTCTNTFSAGQYVTVDGPDSSVRVTLARIVSANATSFTVKSASTTTGSAVGHIASAYALVQFRKSANDVVELATSENHSLGAVSSSVTVDVEGLYDTTTVVARQLVANTATLTTAEAHGYSVGGTVIVSGLTELVGTRTGSMTISGGTATFTVETATPHNLISGNTVTVTNVKDSYSVTGYAFTYATSSLIFTTSATHNIATNDKVVIAGIPSRTVPCTSIYITNKIVRLTAPANHNVKANDKITVSGYKTTKTLTVSKLTKYGKKAAIAGVTNYSLVNIRFTTAHGLKAGVYLTTSWTSPIGSGYFKNGKFKVTKVIDANTLQYDDGIDYPNISTSVTSPGTVAAAYSYGVNGSWTVSSVAATYIYFKSDEAENTSPTADATTVLVADSVLGEHTVTGATTTTFTVSATPYTVDRARSPLTGATATVAEGIFNVVNANVVSTPSGTSLTYEKSTTTYPNLRVAVTSKTITGNTTVLSPYFNTTGATITAVSTNRFSFVISPTAKKTVENAMANPTGVATAGSAFGGTSLSATITAGAGLQYTKLGTGTLSSRRVFGFASGTSNPEIHYGTYGGYTNNSDLLFEFSTQGYSTKQTLPINFRGYETRSIGEELDKYSDVINGFEYRVDCAYDPASNTFKRTFVLLPIIPESLDSYLSELPGGVLYLGTAAPPSAFGADKTVFHFPGNISDISIDESAENSATRFFMVGNIGDLGDNASQPYGVAVDTSLLYPTSGTMTAWPLLDDTHSDQDIYDEDLLYSYAQRYLAEAKPPDMKINITVNGSITPPVGSYSPGDWCTLIVDDDFIQQRLTNDLEPRGDLMVRKIDSINVSVPDGSTFPEKIGLSLVPEWQADQIGK
jgi:hypothetical protein